jgi:hypothetical protein
MNLTATAIEACARWDGPAYQPFIKGRLIDNGGRCCPQGDVLRHAGRSDDVLRSLDQASADREVAALLGISLAHSCLLRIVNDSYDDGYPPQDVLQHPERILGDQAPRVLAFWRRLDAMTTEQWTRGDAEVVCASSTTATTPTSIRDAVWLAAGDAAWVVARNAALAKAAARDAALITIASTFVITSAMAVGAAIRAGGATNEIQGAAVMRERGQPFFFLPMFGISDPDELTEEQP